MLQYFWYTEISNFERIIFCEKDVCWLEITMKNIFGVKNSDTKKKLSEPVSNDFLIETLVVFLEIFNVGWQISLCIF